MFSYCPATARDFSDDDNEVLVKFYDGLKAKVALSDVFPIPREKHAADVRYILRKEAELVGQDVVAWNANRKLFELGMSSLSCLRHSLTIGSSERYNQSINQNLFSK